MYREMILNKLNHLFKLQRKQNTSNCISEIEKYTTIYIKEFVFDLNKSEFLIHLLYERDYYILHTYVLDEFKDIEIKRISSICIWR